MSSTVRVLLADDHAVVRQGFRLILESETDMEVVGEAKYRTGGRGAGGEAPPDRWW